jgi:molybdopterin molybdotransferase
VCPQIKPGEALEVVTGSLVTNDAIAVVRAWEAERVDDTQIAVKRVFPPRFFIEEQGCDLSAGVEVLRAGVDLGAWELGLAAGFGLEQLSVSRRPSVGLFSCGAEVIPFNAPLRPGLIRDSNSIMLSAAIVRAGGIPRFVGIMPDDFAAFREALAVALSENDMVVISGGTAVGGRDFVSDLIREVGELLVDGVPMKSGRPLIMGVASGAPIVGVAGHPPEALRGFRLFGEAAIDRMLGRERAIPEDRA